MAVIFNGRIYTSKSTPAPLLNVELLGTELVLSWIIPSTDFVQQQNSDLSTTNWLRVTNAPDLNLTNLQNEVRLPLSADRIFFRLAAP
jgi:hypothetical protein